MRFCWRLRTRSAQSLRICDDPSSGQLTTLDDFDDVTQPLRRIGCTAALRSHSGVIQMLKAGNVVRKIFGATFVATGAEAQDRSEQGRGATWRDGRQGGCGSWSPCNPGEGPRWRPISIGIGIAALLCSAALAQEMQHPLSRAGTWDLSLWSSVATGANVDSSFGDYVISMSGLRVGRVLHAPLGRGPLRGALEYSFEIMPVFIATQPNVVHGGGISPLGFRWNLGGSQRLQPYLELNGGGVFTTRNIPRGDTSSFNFTADAGTGVTIYRNTHQAIGLGLRFWHLSNAHMGNRNPGVNALEFVVSYHWLKCPNIQKGKGLDNH